jgi:hypothetical protein
VTCYWIDENFILHEALLDFVELFGKHDGDSLAPVILKVLEDYGIEKKLFCLTSDSAGNNGTMCRRLSRLLNARGITWDYTQRHIPCMTHIIHNNVKAFMKGIKAAAVDDDELGSNPNGGSRPDLDDIASDLVFSNILDKIRGIAKKIRVSQGWEAFEDICKSVPVKPLKILLDTATRWGSTQRMLERVLYLRVAVQRFTILRDDCEQFVISDSEWKLVELICGFLWPFRWATEALESTEKPELDRVFWIYNKLFTQIEEFQRTLKAREELDEAWAGELLGALEKMYDHLKKYYRKAGQTVYSDSMILHPRIKLKLFHTADWDDGDANHYAGICRDNYDDNYANIRLSTIEKSTALTGFSQKRKANQLDDEYDRYLDEELSPSRGGHELDMYLLEPTVHIKFALDYWRDNHQKYPHLAMMARDVFAVPPSGAGVEREFSIAGKVATSQRNQLHANTITAIMIYKNYLNRCRRGLKVSLHDMIMSSLGSEEDAEGETEEEVEEAMRTIDEWQKDWRLRLNGVRGTRIVSRIVN